MYAFYTAKSGDKFVKYGRRLQVNHDQNLATFTGKFGANTVYGDITIDATHIGISRYCWEIKIMKMKNNMCIGIDSNRKYQQSDFSNYHREFSTYDRPPKGKFYSYGSDGAIYSCNTMDGENYGYPYKQGDIVRMEVNLNTKTLQYYINDKDQGIAIEEISFT
eukprot:759935_1